MFVYMCIHIPHAQAHRNAHTQTHYRYRREALELFKDKNHEDIEILITQV